MKFKMRFQNNKYVLSFLNSLGCYNTNLYSISRYTNIDQEILESLLERYNGVIYAQGIYRYCIFENQQNIFDCIDQLNLLLKLSGELT
jgi:hypothetical protein